MRKKEAGKLEPERDFWECKTWNMDQIRMFAAEKTGRCVVLIDGYAVDVTSYLGEHVRAFKSILENMNVTLIHVQPGGAALLRRYSVGTKKDVEGWHEAEWAFNGGLNNHSRAARKRMNELRIAKLVD